MKNYAAEKKNSLSRLLAFLRSKVQLLPNLCNFLLSVLQLRANSSNDILPGLETAACWTLDNDSNEPVLFIHKKRGTSVS